MSDEQHKQWYSNKELFELIQQTKDGNQQLRLEMQETRAMIKKYNGLRDEVGKARNEVDEARHEIDNVKGEVEAIKSKSEGRVSVWNGIAKWGGWGVAVLTMFATYIRIFLL